MKLATRYQRINLLVTVAIFLLASGAFYYLLHRVLIFQVDEDLEIEQHEVQQYMSKYGTLPPNIVPVEDQAVSYEKVAGPMARDVRRSILLMDVVEHERGQFRQLVFTVHSNGEWYKVSVSKSLEATEGLARLIGWIALGTIALMLLVSFLVNRMVLRRLWRPFYSTVDALRGFKLGSTSRLALSPTTTDEFSLLNATLETTTGKATRDYELLKEFTENASHELQTPLAIVHSKLDLLIQDEGLSEQQSRLATDAYEAIRRMTHLNHSLLMLAKIENGQYKEVASIHLKSAIEEKLRLFDAFTEDKHLNISCSLEPVEASINPLLADVLLNNLLTNAIQHNTAHGTLSITLSPERLAICNTSANPRLEKEHLFNRFQQATTNATRTGLGLAIARQVCEASGLDLRYDFSTSGLHCFTVTWNGTNTAPKNAKRKA